MADDRPETEPGTTGRDNAAVPVLHEREVSRLRSETGEVASWLIIMAGLVVAAAFAAAMLTFVVNQLAGEVAAAAEVEVSLPETTRPVPSSPEGEFGDGGESNRDALPISTSHCSLTVTASGGLVGLGVGVGGTLEVIIQEMPDGTTLVTIAGDGAISGGTGTSAGAGITVNDATVGAYASASADAWGGLGAGVQFELAPGETVADLFTGLAVSSNPVTGIGAAGINFFFPDTIPTASLPNTVFVDGSAWGTAGGTAQAGVGWVSAGGNASGEGRVNQAYAAHDNGTYSATTTYSGELSGDAGITGGIPFFAWGSANLAGEAVGSVSVQTIYDSDFNAVEMIVTTSYGADGDAIFGSDDDDPTITTQQWSLDLTDPDVAQAVNDLDALLPGPIPSIPTQLPSQTPLDAFDVLSDSATTTGPLSQQLSTSQLDIALEAGAIVADVSGGVNGTCTQLR